MPPSPTAKVTIAALDARLVAALGLTDSAKLFTQAAKTAGLKPPSRFGTEAVARLLGLRTNHPAALDALELSPGQPANHAEAAYSAARILQLGERATPGVQELAASFVLPALTPWQKKVLTTAVRFIGYPYVWGGESEFTQHAVAVRAAGTRRLRLLGIRLARLQGRAVRRRRHARGHAQGPHDVCDERRGSCRETNHLRQAPARRRHLLRSERPKSKAAQVDHMGVYLGNGWFIHSSSYGVAVTTLSGWYEKRFAWGRRPLAEAGLVSPA